MDIYVELTYCMNGILFIMTYEMISLLLNIHWSFMKILFLSFLSNISVILIYIDYLPYISFLYWFVLFLFADIICVICIYLGFAQAGFYKVEDLVLGYA